MATNSHSSSALQLSRAISYDIFSIIVMVLSLEILGLLAALLLTWVIASALGQGLDRYPWHFVLFIDFAFILFSAVLAEYAEGALRRNIEAEPDAPAWNLTSFIIAIGALAPLASHTGKIWRDLLDHPGDPPQESTILSEVLCAYVKGPCTETYFTTIFGLSVASCVLALLAAYLLRTHASSPPPAHAKLKSFLTFCVSILLFAFYTILNQKWDVPGIKLAALSWVEIAWIGAAFLFMIASLVFASRKVVVKARGIRVAVRDYSDASGKQASLLQKLAPLFIGATAIVMSVAALAVVGGLIVALKNVLPERIGDAAIAVQLFQFLTNLFYLTLGLAGVCVAPILAGVLWTIGRALVARLKRAPAHHDDEKEEEDGSEDSEREAIRGPRGKVEPRRAPSEWVLIKVARAIASGIRAAVVRVSNGLILVIQRLGEVLGLAAQAIGVLAGRVGEFLFGQRAKARRAAAGVLVFCAIGLSVAMAYDVIWLQPYEGASGKAALQPSGGSSGKPGTPRLAFYRASIACPWDARPVWALGEVETLQTTSDVRSCLLEADVSIPCWAGSIVVAGTASVSRDADAEKRRAYDRGRSLAQVLGRDFIRRCGNVANVRIHVLNLGPYAQGPRLNDAAAQREVYVLAGGGDSDSAETIAAVEDFARQNLQFADYTSCDLYSLDATGEVTSTRKLDCRSGNHK